MLSTAASLYNDAAPWYGAAAAVLVMAWRLTASARASAQRQGARIGAIERAIHSERNRRRQVEAELTAQGIALPYWPEDPLPAAIRRPAWRSAELEEREPAEREPLERTGYLERDDDDERRDETSERRIPIPPLPRDIGARHRRSVIT